MPPWTLPGNATQSGLISRSMKGGSNNANAIRFEDKQGAEELWLQAERNMRTEVKHDETHSVTNDRKQRVGRDEVVNIGHDHVHISGNNKTVGVGAAFSTVVGEMPDPRQAPLPPGTYVLDVKESILIRCGDSSIFMSKEGMIEVKGKQISEEAADYFLMKGGKIDLNP
jgi:type VI secretion system secreted protein VgrG